MATKDDTIEKMLQRKKDIIANLDRLKQEIHKFDVQHDHETPKIVRKSDKSHLIEMDNLLCEIDKLKIQNDLLTKKLQQAEVIMAENTLLCSQLNACRLQLSEKVMELSEAQKRNVELESTISSLKEEIYKSKRHTSVMREPVNSKKMDNSERISMINQQQSLIIEIERIKSEYDKYKDLIASIETVASTGKICLVSSRGLKVTTMLELAQEIKNFK